MAFTQTQLDDLDAAIASGELTVHYSTPQGGRTRTFRSLAEMLQVRNFIARALGQVPAGPNRVLAQHSAGYRPAGGEESSDS